MGQPSRSAAPQTMLRAGAALGQMEEACPPARMPLRVSGLQCDVFSQCLLGKNHRADLTPKEDPKASAPPAPEEGTLMQDHRPKYRNFKMAHGRDVQVGGRQSGGVGASLGGWVPVWVGGRRSRGVDASLGGWKPVWGVGAGLGGWAPVWVGGHPLPIQSPPCPPCLV